MLERDEGEYPGIYDGVPDPSSRGYGGLHRFALARTFSLR